MTDLGTCQIRLEACNRTATVRMTLRDTRTAFWETYKLCRQHADQIKLVHGVFHWQIHEERIDDDE